MKSQLLLDLNPKQREAVVNIDGPSIILAGAGSGKTRVLIYKVINLIINHHINPRTIMMITFTNKAASEMRERIKQNVNNDQTLGFVGTFHSFCARILRIEGELIGIVRNFVIYDESDQLNLIKTLIKKSNFDKKYSPSYILNRISAAKNQNISPENFLNIFSDHAAADITYFYKNYQLELEKNQALDFDDLIVKTIKLFEKHPSILEKYHQYYRYILIDEFQDTNWVQYLLIKLLGKKYQNITVVGDFSQSIYSWRGAEIENLRRFESDFPSAKTFYLEKNYRSTQPILDFAFKIISKNQTHPILNLHTDIKTGNEIIFYEGENEEDECFYVANQIIQLKKQYPLDDITVLYRTNAQSRVIEEVFLHQAIPYLLIGGVRFYERKEIKDIVSFLRLLVNPNDEMAKTRVEKLGKKRWEKFLQTRKKIDIIHQKTEEIINNILEETDYLSFFNPNLEEDFSRLENIKELKSVAISFPKINEFLEQIALVESEYFENEIKRVVDKEEMVKEQGRVRLMTLHQAKGLEFSVVFIIGVEEGLLPHSKSLDDPYSLEEERRLFYVGITRAKKELFITWAKQRFIFGSRGYTSKSRFIIDI
jgi:DNA helicase-2/ATP-dependent DNA helicase PcrA